MPRDGMNRAQAPQMKLIWLAVLLEFFGLADLGLRGFRLHGALAAAEAIAMVAALVVSCALLALPRRWSWWANTAVQAAVAGALVARGISHPTALWLLAVPAVAVGGLRSAETMRYYGVKSR